MAECLKAPRFKGRLDSSKLTREEKNILEEFIDLEFKEAYNRSIYEPAKFFPGSERMLVNCHGNFLYFYTETISIKGVSIYKEYNRYFITLIFLSIIALMLKYNGIFSAAVDKFLMQEFGTKLAFMQPFFEKEKQTELVEEFDSFYHYVYNGDKLEELKHEQPEIFSVWPYEYPPHTDKQKSEMLLSFLRLRSPDYFTIPTVEHISSNIRRIAGVVGYDEGGEKAKKFFFLPKKIIDIFAGMKIYLQSLNKFSFIFIIPVQLLLVACCLQPICIFLFKFFFGFIIMACSAQFKRVFKEDDKIYILGIMAISFFIVFIFLYVILHDFMITFLFTVLPPNLTNITPYEGLIILGKIIRG